jgi:hypothetical protein
MIPMTDAILHRLTAYVDGELSPAERDAVERLLADSAEARRLVDRLQRDAGRLRALRRLSAPVEISNRIMAQVSQPHVVRLHPARTAARRWLSVAAAAAVVTGVGLGTFAVLQQIARQGQNEGLARNTGKGDSGASGANVVNRAGPANADRESPPLAIRQAKLPTAQQLTDSATSLSDNLRPLVRGLADLLDSSREAVARGFVRSEAEEGIAGEAGLASPTFLTSQMQPTKAFKSLALSKLPLFLDIKDLDSNKLLGRLREDPLHHVDLSCQESWKSFERVQAACKATGIRLIIDAEVSQRQSMKLPASCLIYLENVPPDVVARLLQSLQVQEKSAEQQKKGDGQFGSIMVSTLDDIGRKRLAETLGVPPATLVPAKKAKGLGGPAGSVDPTKPLARETERALEKLAAGPGRQGGAKPAGKEPTAVVLLAVPNRNRLPVSKEVRAHLDARVGLQAEGLGVAIVLRPAK